MKQAELQANAMQAKEDTGQECCVDAFWKLWNESSRVFWVGFQGFSACWPHYFRWNGLSHQLIQACGGKARRYRVTYISSGEASVLLHIR